MPRYEFRCPDCSTVFQEKRPFARADEAAVCPACHGDRAAKVIGSAMFYSPGSAAKSLLDPKPASRPVPAGAHPGGCPCCSGRTVI